MQHEDFTKVQQVAQPTDDAAHLPNRTNLPHYLSERNFRFFEPYITLGVNNWPSETSWDISLLRSNDPTFRFSPVTFIARVRDACTSYHRFKWDSNIDRVKFETIAGKYAWSLQPGTSTVWFKHRGARGRPTANVVEARQEVAASASGPVLWRDITSEELDALCLLITNGRLTGTYLTNVKIEGASADLYMKTNNVSILWDDEKKMTVIT